MKLMRNNWSVCLLAVLFTLNVHTQNANATKETPAYWLWAGHSIQTRHQNAILYLHQGLVRNVKVNTRAFYKRGFDPHKMNAKSLYVVIRMQKLIYDKRFIFELSKLLKRWEKQGNQVTGLQLDFDSATNKLLKYAQYLKFVRKLLPKKYNLSVTGLGDWLVNGNKKHLFAISNQVNEIVFQLYQHKTAFTNITPYITKLASINIAFKIGLVERGRYNQSELNKLKLMPHYQGLIIFSLK